MDGLGVGIFHRKEGFELNDIFIYSKDCTDCLLINKKYKVFKDGERFTWGELDYPVAPKSLSEW